MWVRLLLFFVRGQAYFIFCKLCARCIYKSNRPAHLLNDWPNRCNLCAKKKRSKDDRNPRMCWWLNAHLLMFSQQEVCRKQIIVISLWQEVAHLYIKTQRDSNAQSDRMLPIPQPEMSTRRNFRQADEAESESRSRRRGFTPPCRRLGVYSAREILMVPACVILSLGFLLSLALRCLARALWVWCSTLFCEIK